MKDWYIVELIMVIAKDGTISFAGKCTQNWKHYSTFRVTEQEAGIYPIRGCLSHRRHVQGL